MKILISIHCNAAGPGDRWLSARGWCAYTTPGPTGADALATSLYTAQLSNNRKDNLPSTRANVFNTLHDSYLDYEQDIDNKKIEREEK